MFLLSVDWIMFTPFGPQLPVEPGASLSQVVGEQNAKWKQMLIIGPTTTTNRPLIWMDRACLHSKSL